MKIEQVLVHYLIKNKELKLQGIGIFHLEASLPDTIDPDKPVNIPADAISFIYDPKVTEDDQLVDFLVEHTKKIKPLASSDLDSYLSLGRQFLNIGKPFILPNIGTLEKANSGELIFTGGQPVAQRMEPQKAKTDDEGAEGEEENLFNDYHQDRRKGSNKQAFFVIITLLLVAAAGWAAWRYLFNNPTNDISTTQSVIPVTDSAKIIDSLTSIQALSDSNNISAADTDSTGFKVVVGEYSTAQAATKRLTVLKKYNRNVIMFTTDSVSFKIAEPFMLPISDTSRITDSLNRYYGKGKTHIEF